MTKPTECGATVDLADDRTLTCHLDQGHDGPVHDDNGHQWGDLALPQPVEPEVE